jgi:hypothetical protein
MYSPFLKESLDAQRMGILRILRSFFYMSVFIIVFVKEKFFMYFFKGYFSEFFFPFLFFFFRFLYRIKFYFMNNILYKIVWRSLLFLKNIFFYTKQLDVFFSLMSSIIRKYRYEPITVYIIPSVLWERFGFLFFFVTSFFRPVFKDFLVKFDNVSVDFKLFGLIL